MTAAGLDVARATELYLLYLVMPLWLAAGFADWLCHRRARIELTSGWRESAIHAAMLAEVGVAVLGGLFLEVNALVLAIMLACFLAHEATAHWDLRLALRYREVGAAEQHVHNYLGVVPFLALSFVGLLHWPQALALLGLGPESADFTLAWKARSLPLGYIATLLVALGLFELLPYAEEFLRCWRQRRAAAATRAAGL